MADEFDEALRWLEQAALDLAEAEDSEDRYPRTACFLAQQAAEKALDAIVLARTSSLPRVHSVEALADLLPDLAENLGPRGDLLKLDRLYIQTRYPDALPWSVPSRHFTPADAAEALPIARRVVGVAGQVLKALGEG